MNDTEKYQLFAEEFTPEDQPELAGLQFGGEPWSRAAREWISGSEVLDCINNLRTKVWVYRDLNDSVVGFSSLEPTGSQRWPPPDGKRSRLLYIRQLAIDSRFRGFPPDPDWRFSKQIMDHLISKAHELALQIRSEKPPSKHVELLTLHVHKDNLGAQTVYRRAEFELLEGFESNNHVSMVHKLDLPNSIQIHDI